MIAVEITHGDESRAIADGVKSGGSEITITDSKKNGDTVGAAVGDGQIQNAIAIEIANGHRKGRSSGDKISGRSKRAVLISEQDGNVIGTAVGHSQILNVVAIEVADRNGFRSEAHHVVSS